MFADLCSLQPIREALQVWFHFYYGPQAFPILLLFFFNRNPPMGPGTHRFRVSHIERTENDFGAVVI